MILITKCQFNIHQHVRRQPTTGRDCENGPTNRRAGLWKRSSQSRGGWEINLIIKRRIRIITVQAKFKTPLRRGDLSKKDSDDQNAIKRKKCLKAESANQRRDENNSANHYAGRIRSHFELWNFLSKMRCRRTTNFAVATLREKI